MKICPEKYSAMIVATGFIKSKLTILYEHVKRVRSEECGPIPIIHDYNGEELENILSCDGNDCAKYRNCVERFI